MGDRFVNLVESIEKLAYKLLIWIILIPKTIIKIILNPGFASDYIRDELANDRESPFDEYMSPMLLYLGVTLLPAIMLYFLPTYGLYPIDPSTNKEYETFVWSATGRTVSFITQAKFKSDTNVLFHQVEWRLWQSCDYSIAQSVSCLVDDPKFIEGVRFSEWSPNYSPLINKGNKEFEADDTHVVEKNQFSILGDRSTVSYSFPVEFKAPGSYWVEIVAQNFVSAVWETPVETYSAWMLIDVPALPEDTGELEYPIRVSWYTQIQGPFPAFNKGENPPKDFSDALSNAQTILIGLGLLIPPLIFALGMNLFHKEKGGLSESDLREGFYAQCYYFVPVGLAFWSWYYSTYFYTVDIPIPSEVFSVDVFFIPILAIAVWFVVVQTQAIARERQMEKSWHAIPIAIICIVFIIFLVYAIYWGTTSFTFNWARKSAIGFYPVFVAMLALWALGSAVRKWWKERGKKEE
jgi:hypothetical protein